MTDSLSLTGRLWRFRGEQKPGESIFSAFCRVRNFSPEFLQAPTVSHLANSQDLPGVKTATERIEHAISQHEHILIFGDFDSDGASGAAVLYLALKALGAQVTVVLPSRGDGYGLSEKIYQAAAKQDVSLFITVDCGSSNGSQIEFGNSLGIDTIVTDHHSLPKKLPKAVAVVHPHLADPSSDLYDITGAGVAFFVAKNIIERRFSEAASQNFILRLAELAVIGTVADVGLLTGQNRIITALGLEQMRKMQHPGLRSLFQIAKIDSKQLNAETIAFFIAPRLNAAGRLAHPSIALSLLLGSAKAAGELESLNNQRKDVTADLCALAESLVEDHTAPAIVLYHQRFFAGVAGLVAARISEKYHRPVVVLSPSEKDMLTASCRGPDDFHITQALSKAAPLLSKFGGHAAAAGFSMPQENLAAFREKFCELAAAKRGQIPPPPELTADFTTEACSLYDADFTRILDAEPFGVGNPSAVFCIPRVCFDKNRIIGQDGTHLAGNIKTVKRQVPFVAFRFAEVLRESLWSQQFDVLVSAEYRTWNGRTELQCQLKDVRVAV
jgi:single-stranded-DNA-specific exonuclease